MPPSEATPPPDSLPTLIASLVMLAVLLVGIVQCVSLLKGIEPQRERWRRGERYLAWRPLRLRDAGFVLGCLLLATLVASGFRKGPVEPPPEANPLNMVDMSVQFVAFQLLVVVAALVLLRRRGLRWCDAFGDPALSPWSGLGYAFRLLLAVMPVMLVIGFLTQMILKAFGVEPESQAVLQLLLAQDNPYLLLAGLFFAVVGAPVSEELLFRGLLLPALSKWMSTASAIFLTSMVFALIHLAPQQMPALFVLSLLLSLSYLYTRRLETAIALHAMFNGTMITIALLSTHATR
jgi:membrane protease YdiL (CAAX protease family)